MTQSAEQAATPPPKPPPIEIAAVGSMSDIKIGAVQHASDYLNRTHGLRIAVHGVPGVQSDIPEQPYGDLVILTGARNRARRVVDGLAIADSVRGAATAERYVFAIENGIARRPAGHVDVAYAMVVAPSGRVTVRGSDEVPVPEELVAQAEASGWTVTAGKLEAARTPSCRHDDPHVVWSSGRTNRLNILTDVVLDVLHAALRAEKVLR
jgi:non-canonical (house-cleaning) NTP pyrophosphatase